MRSRYVGALVSAAAVASGCATGASSPPTESRGALLITPSQELPDNLTGLRYLLLDSGRVSEVEVLKQRNPHLKILAYKNLSFLIDYSRDELGNAGVPWPDANLHESWFLRDEHGRRVRSVHFKDSWFADVGNPSYQSSWRQQVSSFLRSAPWDGVFVDDALADPGWHLGGAYRKLARYPGRKAYRRAERSMLAAIAPGLERDGYLVIANVFAARDQQDVWADWARILSGAMLERFAKSDGGPGSLLTGTAWKRDVDAERAVEGAGKIFSRSAMAQTTRRPRRGTREPRSCSSITRGRARRRSGARTQPRRRGSAWATRWARRSCRERSGRAVSGAAR